MTFRDVENILVRIFENNPDMKSQLTDDFGYLAEDEIVFLIAQEMTAKGIDVETLSHIDSKGWIEDASIREIPNIYDFVIQATLMNPTTPQESIRALLLRNHDWMKDGWWCAQRLLQNPNLESDLVTQCAEAAI